MAQGRLELRAGRGRVRDLGAAAKGPGRGDELLAIGLLECNLEHVQEQDRVRDIWRRCMERREGVRLVMWWYAGVWHHKSYMLLSSSTTKELSM